MMIRNAYSKRMVALATGTAFAALALGGCATADAPRADLSASKAATALAKGRYDRAVEHAEAAVLADPRNPAYRAALAATYLEAGRFRAAATSFADTMQLGDESGSTALGLALAQSGSGDFASAAALLDDWRDDIPPADLGLAFALAGRPDRGVHILGNAIRNGENNAQVRQNLAYAYALQGNWRAARIMAAEDVPAGKVGDRMAEWASTARPELFRHRIARLLGAPLVADSGQPAHLALANFPSVQQLAAEAATPASLSAPQPENGLTVAEPGELPATQSKLSQKEAETDRLEKPAAEAPTAFDSALEAASSASAIMAAAARATIRFVSDPVVQNVSDPAKRPAPAPRPAVVRKPPAPDGRHLAQLGSFTSYAEACRAWDVLTGRFPQVDDYPMVVTEARVKGQAYFRVSAGGLQQSDARSLCRTVQARGEGCIVWAEGKPLPGAVDSGIRMAIR